MIPKIPTVEELDAAVRSFPLKSQYPRGFDHIPEFKKFIFEQFNSKITVKATIECSNILTVWYATSFRLDQEKYMQFLENCGLEPSEE